MRNHGYHRQQEEKGEIAFSPVRAGCVALYPALGWRIWCTAERSCSCDSAALSSATHVGVALRIDLAGDPTARRFLTTAFSVTSTCTIILVSDSVEGWPGLQFVADGVFYAELNEMLTRELAEHGYSGVEVRVTPMRTEIIIRATRTQNVLGKHLSGPTFRCDGSTLQKSQWPYDGCLLKSSLVILSWFIHLIAAPHCSWIPEFLLLQAMNVEVPRFKFVRMHFMSIDFLLAPVFW